NAFIDDLVRFGALGSVKTAAGTHAAMYVKSSDFVRHAFRFLRAAQNNPKRYGVPEALRDSHLVEKFHMGFLAAEEYRIDSTIVYEFRLHPDIVSLVKARSHKEISYLQERGETEAEVWKKLPALAAQQLPELPLANILRLDGHVSATSP